MQNLTENVLSESMIKSAIMDMMNKNKDLFKEIISSAIQDIGMVATMKDTPASEMNGKSPLRYRR